MKFTRLFTGTDQQSHFEDLEIPTGETYFGGLVTVTAPLTVASIAFGEIDGLDEVPWHNPPCRQYIMMLQGAMEIEIGDGTRRIFNVGDVVLAEDTTGQGHITRAASKGVRRYLFAPLK